FVFVQLQDRRLGARVRNDPKRSDGDKRQEAGSLTHHLALQVIMIGPHAFSAPASGLCGGRHRVDLSTVRRRRLAARRAFVVVSFAEHPSSRTRTSGLWPADAPVGGWLRKLFLCRLGARSPVRTPGRRKNPA